MQITIDISAVNSFYAICSMIRPLAIAEVSGITEKVFDEACLHTFRFQYHANEVYRKFCDLLKRTPGNVCSLTEIPFLPVEFFKSHRVSCAEKSEIIFESSGTTGEATSKHYVPHLSYYEESFLTCFDHFYGSPAQWVILALLPSYLERSNSSLVYMTDRLIEQTRDPISGFVLSDLKKLSGILQQLKKENRKTMLLGVTYALLDLAEKFPMNLSGMVVMETGGMKGRREELTRQQVHARITEAFNLHVVHSEYGMTELLSQAYSDGHGIFRTPQWMKILSRATDDPQMVSLPREQKFPGATNIIDLANQYSCSFIATDDLNILHPDGSFEIMGRIDNCDIRGCSLMTA